jgi:hypothetical protein
MADCSFCSASRRRRTALASCSPFLCIGLSRCVCVSRTSLAVCCWSRARPAPGPTAVSQRSGMAPCAGWRCAGPRELFNLAAKDRVRTDLAKQHRQRRDLRRPGVVRMAEAGVTAPQIAALAGWSIDCTQRIADTSPPRRAEVALAGMLIGRPAGHPRRLARWCACRRVSQMRKGERRSATEAPVGRVPGNYSANCKPSLRSRNDK